MRRDCCWIIGSAPGLNKVDVGRLIGHPTLAFNRSYIAWRDWGFAPWYYCVIDLRVLRSIAADVDQLIRDRRCHSYHFYDGHVEGVGRLVIETADTKFYRLRDGWGFEPERMFYCGDVAAFSLQVAYRMGYRRVFVVGVDLIWPERSELAVDDGQKRVATLDNDVEHFRKDYYPAGMEYSFPHAEAHFNAWRKSLEDIRNFDFDVISCSPGSRLNELMPYVEFEKCLRTIS